MTTTHKIDLLLAFAEAHTTETDVGAAMRALASEVRVLRGTSDHLREAISEYVKASQVNVPPNRAPKAWERLVELAFNAPPKPAVERTNRGNCDILVAELSDIRARLQRISDASYDDMEGADQPDFSIAEEFHVGCAKAAEALQPAIDRVQKLNVQRAA